MGPGLEHDLIVLGERVIDIDREPIEDAERRHGVRAMAASGADQMVLPLFYSLTSGLTVSHVVTPFMGLSINWKKA